MTAEQRLLSAIESGREVLVCGRDWSRLIRPDDPLPPGSLWACNVKQAWANFTALIGDEDNFDHRSAVSVSGTSWATPHIWLSSGEVYREGLKWTRFELFVLGVNGSAWRSGVQPAVRRNISRLLLFDDEGRWPEWQEMFTERKAVDHA